MNDAPERIYAKVFRDSDGVWSNFPTVPCVEYILASKYDEVVKDLDELQEKYANHVALTKQVVKLKTTITQQCDFVDSVKEENIKLTKERDDARDTEEKLSKFCTNLQKERDEWRELAKAKTVKIIDDALEEMDQ